MENHSTTEGGPATRHRLEIELSTYPDSMVEYDQWILWKRTSDGRKIPRAPWATGDPLRFVNGLDPANWTSFGTAVEWANKLTHRLEPAFALSEADPFTFIDLDDVIRDGGRVEAPVAHLLSKADSYAAVSSSGSGIHRRYKADAPTLEVGEEADNR